LGGRKSILPVKNEWWGAGVVMSGTRCRFACGPADATAAYGLLLQEIMIGLPFWCRLTRVVLDRIQRVVKWL